MYHTSLANLGYAVVLVQHQVALLPDLLRKWRMTINTIKSETITFSPKLTCFCQPVSLNGCHVAWKRSLIYLGVTLYRRLSIAAHQPTSPRVSSVPAGSNPSYNHFFLIGVQSLCSINSQFICPFLQPTLRTQPLPFGHYSAHPFTPVNVVTRLESFQSRTLRYISSSPGLSEMKMCIRDRLYSS